MCRVLFTHQTGKRLTVQAEGQSCQGVQKDWFEAFVFTLCSHSLGFGK
jgi:hypothetical protein